MVDLGTLLNPKNTETSLYFRSAITQTIVTNNVETKNINGKPYIPCDFQSQNTLKIQHLENDFYVNKKSLDQLLLTVQQQSQRIELLTIIMFIIFVILLMSLYEIFKLKQIKVKEINIIQDEESKNNYIKENEELKKRIDFFEHDC